MSEVFTVITETREADRQSVTMNSRGSIDSALVVETDKGPVHPGPCYNYIKELPVSESSEEQLNETQLLL